jgi:hypothetical protein
MAPFGERTHRSLHGDDVPKCQPVEFLGDASSGSEASRLHRSLSMRKKLERTDTLLRTLSVLDVDALLVVTGGNDDYSGSDYNYSGGETSYDSSSSYDSSGYYDGGGSQYEGGSPYGGGATLRDAELTVYTPPGGDRTTQDAAGIEAAERYMSANRDVDYVGLTVRGVQENGVPMETRGGWGHEQMREEQVNNPDRFIPSEDGTQFDTRYGVVQPDLTANRLFNTPAGSEIGRGTDPDTGITTIYGHDGRGNAVPTYFEQRDGTRQFGPSIVQPNGTTLYGDGTPTDAGPHAPGVQRFALQNRPSVDPTYQEP